MTTKHITAYYIDARDGRPANESPLRHGPARPSETMAIDAVDRRQDPPLIIGRIPVGESLSPGMTLIGEQEHADLLADYIAWQDANAQRTLDERREAMVVSRFQARAVLRQMGLREQVETIMGNPETDPLAIDAWADATEFRRTSPTVAALATALDLGPAQIDELFEAAATIEA